MTAPVDRAAMAARYTVANYAEWDTEKRNEYGGGFLLRPDGTDLAMLGEHEDCTWVRDGAPVVEELNRLLADVERLTAERDALAEAVREVAEEQRAYFASHCWSGISAAQLSAWQQRLRKAADGGCDGKA